MQLSSFIKKNKKSTKIIAVILISYICFIFIGTSFIGYMNYMPKDEVRWLVEQFEEVYYYEESISTPEYRDKREELLANTIITKKAFNDFLNSVKEDNDIFTFFSYDDYFNDIDKFSKTVEGPDGFTTEVLITDIGYISFAKFDQKKSNGLSTGDRFVESLSTFQEAGIRNVVIDLRNNVGGSVTEVINIADSLLPKGKEILRTDYKYSSEIRYTTAKFFDFEKIFILLNKESASCAEILPLSLYENLGEKVVLIGNETKKKV